MIIKFYLKILKIQINCQSNSAVKSTQILTGLGIRSLVFRVNCPMNERKSLSSLFLKKRQSDLLFCFGHKRGKAGWKEPTLSFLFFKRANQS